MTCIKATNLSAACRGKTANGVNMWSENKTSPIYQDVLFSVNSVCFLFKRKVR
jgi:hypothetical protein